MLTDKQLTFALSDIQEKQKKYFGKNIGICINTSCKTTEFIVIIEYGFKTIDNKSCYSLERTFEFLKKLTEDQCLDYLQDIDKIIKENAEQ